MDGTIGGTAGGGARWGFATCFTCDGSGPNRAEFGVFGCSIISRVSAVVSTVQEIIMPFTLAHPIAALPIWELSQKRLNLLGLMVGSIVPDMAYFLTLQPIGTVRHTVPGVLTYGIAEGLLLVAIGRHILLRPLLAIGPKTITQRCQIPTSRQSFSIVDLVILIVSIVLGALSHLIWDSFSHETGWFVQNIAWLRQDVGRMPFYKLVQYLSGLLGLAGLGGWLYAWWRQAEPTIAIESLPLRLKAIVWNGIGVITLLFMWLAITLHALSIDTTATIVVRAIIGAISGGFVGLVLYAIGFWINRSPLR
jgi:Domain of unknown function (DUF4184)